MTSARQQRKRARFSERYPGRSLNLAILTVAMVLGGLPLARPPLAGTSEAVVTDRHTGLAINGFDPVAYFIDREAVMGRGEHEYGFAGAVWRFRNEGNRGAFADDPDLYMPRFGGYDPVGIVRGVAVPGDPRLWLVIGERLYLFYSTEARNAFAEDADGIAALAYQNWAAVQRTLSP
jgi:hypothetical protein